LAPGRHRSIPPQRQPSNSQLQDQQITSQKKTRTAPPTPRHRQCGWLPRHTTYTTHPINPDLDAVPTGTFELTAHPALSNLVLLHAPDGRLNSTIPKLRLRKLSNTNHPQDTNSTFPEGLSEVILRHNTTTYKESSTKERKLHKPHKHNQRLEYEESYGTYPTPYTTRFAIASRSKESYTVAP
jgi:hypothetical protein